MNIIINISNKLIGGGLQVALSVLEECKLIKEHSYHIFLNENIEKQIDKNSFPDNFIFHEIPKVKFWQLSKYLNHLENEIQPNVVFTIFGPSYWKPKAPHLMGFARGHAIFDDSLYRKSLKGWKRFLFDVKNSLLIHFSKKNSQHFVVETEYAQYKLKEKITGSNVYCVSNTYSGIYDQPEKWTEVNLPEKNQNEFWLIHICANYPHKNLQILPGVISHLKENDPNRDYKILLSINENELLLTEEQKKHFIFLGRLNVTQCPAAYKASDALLMTSLIETFSVSYVEAMKMELPILTSDLDFAHDTCQDAALYFKPLSAQDIGDKIILLASSSIIQKKLINSGTNRLKDFLSSRERTNKYLEICKLISNETNNTRP